jgi:hypothetical protein
MEWNDSSWMERYADRNDSSWMERYADLHADIMRGAVPVEQRRFLVWSCRPMVRSLSQCRCV